MAIIDTQKQEIIPILVGLIINKETTKFVKSNESIPVHFVEKPAGNVMVVDRMSLIKLRENIDKLLVAFP